MNTTPPKVAAITIKENELDYYNNGPDGMPRVKRLPDAVINCLIDHSAFRYLAASLARESAERLNCLIHDVAEEVLARVSMATPTTAAEGVPSVDTPCFNDLLGTYGQSLIGGSFDEMESHHAALIANLNADKAAAVEKARQDGHEAGKVEGMTIGFRGGEFHAKENLAKAEARVRELEALLDNRLQRIANKLAEPAAQEAAKPSEGSGDVRAALEKVAQDVRYYLKHQDLPAWESASEYEKGVRVTAENIEKLILERAALAQPAEPGGGLRKVGYTWLMHGWTVTAHGKHHSINRYIDQSPPTECTKSSPDFISVEPVYVRTSSAERSAK